MYLIVMLEIIWLPVKPLYFKILWHCLGIAPLLRSFSRTEKDGLSCDSVNSIESQLMTTISKYRGLDDAGDDAYRHSRDTESYRSGIWAVRKSRNGRMVSEQATAESEEFRRVGVELAEVSLR